jgi:pyrimidine-nucleoside phosphorylase
MIHLGGQAATHEAGYARAEAVINDGSALRVFFSMVEAQGGNSTVFDDPAFHKPGATQVLEAWETGFIFEMETTKIGWAVQRLGAGRQKADKPVDPHAGILFHARRGACAEKGQPIATLYATSPTLLSEPIALLKEAIHFSNTPPNAVPLVSRIFTRETAEAHLRDAVR